ncbi:hypothetical protein [Mycobacterium sp. DL592]|uniref:hypothetical protein n=1 Tax=Mycobacterium sp. DL592 TaxID=2675524 RepID=UPI0014201C0D|nr:hypothetical protein [Mycobacterium sp. DL592]
MPRPFESTSARPYSAGLAAASVGIVTLGLLTAPPTITGVAAPHAESHLLQLAAVTTADVSTAVVRISAPFAAVASPPSVPGPAAVRPAAASRTSASPAASATASATSSSPPDLLALAASFLDYLNSLGLGPVPGLLAIGVGGVVVALGAVVYAWNGFAGLVNPLLDFLHIPRVPTVPVCFFGQNCGSAAAAQARPAAASAAAADSGESTAEPVRKSVGRSNRDAAAATAPARTIATPATARAAATPNDNSARDTTPTADRDAKKSTGSAAIGSSKRGKTTSTD